MAGKKIKQGCESMTALWGRDIFFSNGATDEVPVPYKYCLTHVPVSNPKVAGPHSEFKDSLDDRETLSQLTKQL